MAKPKEAGASTRTSIKEVKAQLERLTAKLKEFENARCAVENCNMVFDGLRLSQEVEILQKQNAALREENETLKRQLAEKSKSEAS